MKRFATCTVASILATATWATDFVWTGNGGAAANWTHPVNWSVGGATANTYPQTDDTATSFSGTSANVTALLNTLNANEKSGSWRVRAVPTGNGAYTLTIAYSKSGFMIIFK